MESGPCTESDWGEFEEPLTGEEKSVAELQAMTPAELYTMSTSPPFGDALQGPHPTIDGWVLPNSAVKLMDAGGFNADAVLIGANSFDGIFGGFDQIAPDSQSFFQDFAFGLLGLSGFSLSGTLTVMEQYLLRTIYMRFKLEVVAGFCAARPIQRREMSGFEPKSSRKLRRLLLMLTGAGTRQSATSPRLTAIRSIQRRPLRWMAI
jgi:hypothetical protein